MFAAWGRFVYRRRWVVLLGSALLLAGSVAGLRAGGELKPGNQGSAGTEAARASRLVASDITARNLAQAPAAPLGVTFIVLLSSPTLTAPDAAFRTAATDALAPLRADPRVVSVTTPYDATTPAQAAALTSRDGHAIIASVRLRDGQAAANRYVAELEQEVRSPVLKVVFTGNLLLNKAFNDTLESDLHRAEAISLPVALLLLVLIFGAVVAASLPLLVGVLSILGGLAATGILARFTDVSQYALNIVTLIGLGVAIDYSLFVVNRFRDELAAGASREEALAITLATAGRAITFSGVTVAIGLSAMLFYQGTFLASMGAAGGLVVGIAVLYGIPFLPALLAVLGPHVDRLPVRAVLGRATAGRGTWERLAGEVMRRPVAVLVPALAVLVALGLPFLQLRLANGDVHMLPPRLAARQGYDQLVRDFPGQDQTTFTVVVSYPSGDPLAGGRTGDLYDLSRRLAAQPGVTAVQSPVDLDPRLGRSDYLRLYALPPDQRPADAVAADRLLVGTHIVVLNVQSNLAPAGDPARALLRTIRSQRVPGATILVGGATAFDVDVIQYIVERTPGAVGFVMAVTYLVLFLLTGSVVLPVKALAMNLLSVSASFGALVFVFQQGHFASELAFTPQAIDPTIPVILFSTVFGLSMDYEVLLVSRIQEEYRKRGDNTGAVARGLERSGRLITGAAAIMVAVFFSFALAEVVIIKAIGLGLAIAVTVDATLVRALVVPAVMRLLGDLNWWSPAPLRALYERLGLGEMPAGPRTAAA